MLEATQKLQDMYEKFLNCGKGQERERHACYQEVIAAVFYGGEWKDPDRSVLGFLTQYDREFLGKYLWDAWAALDHTKVAINKQTTLLSLQMARAFVNINEQFTPGTLRADKFAEKFPGSWQEFLNYLLKGKMGMGWDLFEWLNTRGELSSPNQTIAPFDKEALLTFTKELGGNLARYRINLKLIRDRNSADDYRNIVISWFDAIEPDLLEKLEEKVIWNFREKEEHAWLVLFSRGGSDKYRLGIIKQAANNNRRFSSTPHPSFFGSKGARLGRPFRIPSDLKDEDLCKVLIWLQSYASPRENVRAIPTVEEFNIRTIGLLLDGGKKNRYDAGAEARANLCEEKMLSR